MTRNTSWKAFESLICKIFNSKRRGADYRNREGAGGLNDCISEDWSIEIKYQKSLHWKDILQDALHARERAKPGQIPIAVARRIGGGRVMDTTLVCMTLRDFMENFVNISTDSETSSQIRGTLDLLIDPQPQVYQSSQPILSKLLETQDPEGQSEYREQSSNHHQSPLPLEPDPEE